MKNPKAIKTINYAIYPLLQFETLLKLVKNEDYVVKHPFYFNSSIGSHVRHSFDHYNTVLENIKNSTTSFTYDKRKRETLVETDRNAGINECDNLMKQIASQSLLSYIDLGKFYHFEKYIQLIIDYNYIRHDKCYCRI